MNDIQQKLRQRAQALLRGGQVRYIIGWGETRFPPQTKPLFIHAPKEAGQLLFNRHCLNNLGKYLLDGRYGQGRIGLCARGCEARAVNRLVQDGQIRREQVYILGLPCPGMEAEKCRLCGCHSPVIYDELLGEPVMEQPVNDRFAAVAELERLDADARYTFWAGAYRRCIRCYACRNVCPACNCPQCYVDQHRTGWQGKQHNLAENMLFGLTRAFHIGDRCIECGECERVCPMKLPLMKLNRKPVKDINELFGDFVGGMDTETPPALATFIKDDLDEFM